MIKVIAGPEKKSRVVTEPERQLTAYHEAGHAVVMHTLPDPGPGAPDHHRAPGTGRRHDHQPARGGPNLSSPAPSYMEDQIVALLGGRVRRGSWCLGDISTGASQRHPAGQLHRPEYGHHVRHEREARARVAFDTGHDEVFIGRSMGHTHTYSETIAVRRGSGGAAPFSTAPMAECTRRLEEHRRELGIVANFLLEHETMSAEEFETVFTQPDEAKESQSTSET